MRKEVTYSQDYTRVAGLPRRRISYEEAEAWAQVMTDDYVCKGSGWEIRPWQGLALAEVARCDGGFLGLPVGVGKTMICELLPVVLGVSRSVLCLPAALREKTYDDRADLMGKIKMASPPATILSFEEMAREENELLLEQLQPELIVVDESDQISNRGKGAPVRIDRYVGKHPEVIVVCMTGTPSRKSIMGYWHQMLWCLRDAAPMPLRESEALLWAAALDEQTSGSYGNRRVKPGPLGENVEQARAWYRRRLEETPGVVIVDGDSAGSVPLTVRVRLAKECTEIDKHYERFLVKQENPAGVPVSDPLSRWRMDAQLGSGVYQYWDPPPPEKWCTARRNVAGLVRAQIDNPPRGVNLDTEAQVLRHFEHHPIVTTWKDIKGTFEPNTAVRWLSTATVESVSDWVREDDTPGIVWCGFVEFANAVRNATRLDYYARKGLNQNGLGLRRADPTKSLIASWHANKRGFNLQPWRRMLIVQPPPSAKYLEQIIGRSHRSGADMRVTVDILATSGGTLDGFAASLGEATFARDSIGITQKLLRADIEYGDHKAVLNDTNIYRWARR